MHRHEMQESNIYLGIYTIEYYFLLKKSGCYNAPYLNLDTVLNEQGSGHRILSDVLHRRPGVVKNEQGSLHLTRRM
jgi:hypothetical protein